MRTRATHPSCLSGGGVLPRAARCRTGAKACAKPPIRAPCSRRSHGRRARRFAVAARCSRRRGPPIRRTRLTESCALRERSRRGSVSASRARTAASSACTGEKAPPTQATGIYLIAPPVYRAGALIVRDDGTAAHRSEDRLHGHCLRGGARRPPHRRSARRLDDRRSGGRKGRTAAAHAQDCADADAASRREARARYAR